MDYANIFDIIEKFNSDNKNTKLLIKTVLNRQSLNILYQGSHIDSEFQHNIQTYIRNSLSSKYTIEDKHSKSDVSHAYYLIIFSII